MHLMFASDASQPSAPSPHELKAALKAFRKRLKLTQLDDQSRIGRGPMSGGHVSGIMAITPPDQFRRPSGKSWPGKANSSGRAADCTS